MALRDKIILYWKEIEVVAETAIDIEITILVLLSTAIFVVETYAIPPQFRSYLDVINTAILATFTLEYILRLWFAKDKIKHIFNLYSIIDLIAILPFMIGFVDISFIRIFRWFRILRLARFLEGRAFFGRISSADGIILLRILFTLFSIVFVYSGLIYQVEHPLNADYFNTFLDAFYFSVVTMTTVGFGDVVPISEMGRLMTVLMILTGVALIPWQLGNLIRQLVKTSQQVQAQCLSCKLTFHDVDACFCKRCGAPLQCLVQKQTTVSSASVTPTQSEIPKRPGAETGDRLESPPQAPST